MKTKTAPHPILKWAGGKSSILHTYESRGLIPEDFQTYYEPFFGAGAMFFHLWNKGLIEKAVISDINIDLFNVYSLVKHHCDELIEYSTSIDLNPDGPTYYRNRSRFNTLKQKKFNIRDLEQRFERAVLMIYLNKTGYSGMYRENKQGLFNVPCGYYNNPTIIDENNLYSVSQSLKHVKIRHDDFNKLLPKLPEVDDFVYLDPPYMPYGVVSHFRDYHHSGFDNERQEELCKAYLDMTNKGTKVMLSNSSNPELNVMYQDQNSDLSILTVPAKRLINQKNKGRITVDEYVIINYDYKTHY